VDAGLEGARARAPRQPLARDATTGQQTQIPFTADVDQMLAELVRFEYPVNDSTLTVRQIRGARPSPNGKRLVFSALDRLWTMDLPSPARVATAHSDADDERRRRALRLSGRPMASTSRTSAGRKTAVISGASRLREGSREADEGVGVLRRDRVLATGTRIVAMRAPREQRAELNEELDRGLIITDLVWIPAAGGQRR
jgi:hypothetical protein